MHFLIVNHRAGTETRLPSEEALVEHCRRELPWALRFGEAPADVCARLDHAQNFSVEREPDGPAGEPVPSPSDRLWRAARLLAGLEHDDAHRAGQVAHEGDPEAGALRAVGLEASEPYREALRAFLPAVEPLGALGKAEGEPASQEPFPRDTAVQAVTPDAQDAAQQVLEAVQGGRCKPFEPGEGKHSSGSLRASTPDGALFLKPQSPQGPQLGEDEQPADQPAREAAAWHALAAMGLERYAPRVDLVLVGGKRYACQVWLGDAYTDLETALKDDPGGTRLRLAPLLGQGILHRLALAEWVLGNPDSNGENSLTSPDDPLQLIDHGAALAGRDFDPSRDPVAYTPFYLRVWSPPSYGRLTPEQKLASLPTLSVAAERELRVWFAAVDRERLRQVVAAHGADPEPVLDRLSRIALAAVSRQLDDVVNRAWSVGL